MKNGGAVGRLALSAACLSGAGLGCGPESGPSGAQHWPVDAGAEVAPGTGAKTCIPAPRTSEDLNPRVDLSTQAGIAASTTPAQQAIKTSELFQRFNTICGRCHVSTVNGGFQVNATTFATVFDNTRLRRIESEDPSFAMPPEGKAFSSRAANDPVVQLARLLEAWIAQGRPIDMFTVEGAPMMPASGAGFYAYSSLTNMGDCIPVSALYASSASGEMDSKDAFFADATELPENLADTDLTSFDTSALAANGVIAFRPTYALWSAGSRKLRFVRVPKGTSIRFDKATQTFDIPPNTRFYKTFFRQVIDSAGRTSYRKMETRLIVARPDTLDVDGKTPKPQALFGTYIWSDDEMSARLLEVPYRDESGFADQTLEYVTNEIEYHDVIDNLGPGAAPLAIKLRAELSQPRHLGLVQHYAVPGSLRCVQCHRGSRTQDFVLGFFPMQIAQRAADTGGVYDNVDADELDQLQRFIDYGLVTSMASPADVTLLEDSQLPRKPRTPGELKAQGYMIGNCSHCHNPRGYPSLAKPELATVLNFLPGTATDAGVFELSFERMSPVRQRGANQDIPIPYITPSLRDYPVTDIDNTRIDNGAVIEVGVDSSGGGIRKEVTWTPKYIPGLEVATPGTRAPGCAIAQGPQDRAYCGNRKTGHSFVAAPWRSLIYRNVDTPFPYFDDYVPFPHMPMNTAGFDCRAPRIIKPKYEFISEDALPNLRRPDGTYVENFIDAPQPYLEVKAGADNYAAALTAAQARLGEYHGSVRYPYCPDVLSPDILDPINRPGTPNGAPRSANEFRPLPDRYLNGGIPPDDPLHPGEYVQPAIGIPYHAEWFDYDPTDSPPPWQPRRADWKKILVDGEQDTSVPVRAVTPTPTELEELATSRRRLFEALQSSELTDELVKYATTPLPYGLWLARPECQTRLAAADIKKVSDFPADQRPTWMNEPGSSPAPSAPVYMMAPGFALYRHICYNCHGPKADGKGLQGDALAASSEGRTRPANFLEGWLGPNQSPGANLLRVFGIGTDDPAVANRWGARYVGWMTLGGTLQLIPQDVVNQVQATKILGQTRSHLNFLGGEAAGVSANMLNLAKGLCAEVLPDESALANLKSPVYSALGWSGDYPLLASSSKSAFIRSNGDWEMWMNLCGRFNRPVVRVYGLRQASDNGGSKSYEIFLKALFYADGNGAGNGAYPSDQPVWDQRQVPANGVTPNNYYPACLQEPASPLPGELNPYSNISTDELAALRARLTMPPCPPAFLHHAESLMWYGPNPSDAQMDAIKEWTLRGAINAGMSVFSYLKANRDKLVQNNLPAYFNECQKLP
jgi:mono/diheme cytochrome c family protein